MGSVFKGTKASSPDMKNIFFPNDPICNALQYSDTDNVKMDTLKSMGALRNCSNCCHKQTIHRYLYLVNRNLGSEAQVNPCYLSCPLL